MSTTDAAIAEILSAKGLALPEVAAPAGAYVPALAYDDLIQTAGQLPFEDGVLPTLGRLGDAVDVETGYRLAQLSILNALAAVKSLTGSLDAIEQIVKVTGFVAATPEFDAHPKVINGASELLGELFGEAGRHSRSAVGVASLPLGAPVEIELLVRVRS